MPDLKESEKKLGRVLFLVDCGVEKIEDLVVLRGVTMRTIKRAIRSHYLKHPSKIEEMVEQTDEGAKWLAKHCSFISKKK